ncbi:MAG: putative type polyketide synthase [Pseudomonadota bacterium]
MTEIPPDRWDTEVLRHPRRSEPGRSVTFSAGVLSRIDEFDAGFFGISPREAAWLDPQQRLLLELTWEAAENGGIPPSSLAGSDCAVYVGISGVDYGVRVMDDLAGMSAHSMTGHALSIAANRLSYVFDLRGASVALDTACSSSLVALHHACNALRTGESSMALVAGVNLLLHPYPFVGFTKASMLSANGRCRAFDSAGDGYVRAEGGVVLMLKPLAQAEADGDDIQAVILATGVNADGSRKTGITIPSREGQSELMRTVLGRAGLAATEIDYIEAHGTGTAVGDPIETGAIGEVYGRARPAGRALPIGSVKTNLGHMEPASGMAGLVKLVLILKNRMVPPSLHLETPNPKIDFAGLNLEAVTRLRPLLPAAGRDRLVVGVNSFGFGGANAHALLEEYPRRVRPAAPPPPVAAPLPPLVLSARHPAALRDLAARYAALLQARPQDYVAVAHGAATRRDRLDKGLILRPASVAEAEQSLRAVAAGENAPGVVIDDLPAETGAIAFVYSGNGAQWLGMGLRLLGESPRFAELMTDLDARLASEAGFSLLEELRREGAASRIDDTAVAQPLLFAIQVAVTTLLREAGIAARAVAGHSVGEVAAAWAAGAFSLDQACRVICARSAAQATTRGQGRMAAVALSSKAVARVIAEAGLDGIELSAINSPNGVSVSGDLARLGQLEAALPAGVFFRVLDLDYAFHSRMMDPIEADLAHRLDGLAPHPTADGPITFVSSVTGAPLDGSALGAEYWWRNVRQPVRFSDAVSALADLGCRLFIEVGPHAILNRYISEGLAARQIEGRVLPTLRRHDDGRARLDEVIGQSLLLAGTETLRALIPAPAEPVRLPNYPWQREHHWHPRSSEAYALINRGRVHPLLGWRLKEPVATWENVLDPFICSWLTDHKVAGGVVLPAAAYVEMALAAARAWFGEACCHLEHLEILSPIVFDGEHARTLRLEVSERDGSFQILSRLRLSEDEWSHNAVGRLLRGPVAVLSTVAAPSGAAEEIGHEEHYRRALAVGLEYGPAFQGLARAERRGGQVQAVLSVPAEIRDDLSRYVLHPALLDVCFQTLLHFLHDQTWAAGPYLPVKVGELRHFGGTAAVAGFRAVLRHGSPRSALADFDLLDRDGRVVAQALGCRFRAAALHRRSEGTPTCWSIRSRLAPLPADPWHGALPAPADLAGQVGSWLAANEAALGCEAYAAEIRPLFDALVVSFAYEAFATLADRPDGWLSSALDGAGSVPPPVRPLFSWLAGLLSREGLLHRTAAAGWRLAPSDLPGARSIWLTLLQDSPISAPALVLAARVGCRLAALLDGDLAAEGVVQEIRHSAQIEAWAEQSPTLRAAALGTRHLLRLVARDWPASQRLRVLEIGGFHHPLAGEGLAEALPDDRFDYVLAPLDEDLRGRLRAELAHEAKGTVADFDPESFECRDRVDPGRFDLVILRYGLGQVGAAALAGLRRRLAPRGLLVLIAPAPELTIDLVSGVAPGWWRDGRDGVPLSPLLSPRAWRTLLAQQGFEAVASCGPCPDDAVEAGVSLLLARPGTETDAAERAAESPAAWLLVVEDGAARPLAQAVADRLTAGTHRVRLTGPELDDPAAARALLERGRNAMGGLDHVVYFGAGITGENDPFGARGALVHAFHLAQTLGLAESRPRLWLITAGGALGASVGTRPDPIQGALWGLGRVVMNENPELGCRLIDVDSALPTEEAARRLGLDLTRGDGESEILLSPLGRHALRMERGALTPPPAAADGGRFRLDFRVPGQLRNLLWLPQPARPLGPDEIEAEVKAAGLNFRDVMYLMGLLPDEAVETGFSGASLGLEFAGVVTRVGAAVTSVAVGEAVVGFGPACFSSHVVTREGAVALKPADWSFEAAATVPTTFFTVYYALKHLADLQPGERVLVHGAAGGIGIATLQLARHFGAEVFATAGSEEKRAFVRLLGADHVFDSRSLSFADEVRAATGGEGVDVILNSLAGEAVRRNLGVLKPFGRFVELGKRDYFQNTPVGLRYFKDNISYFGVDADQLLVRRPVLAARLFDEVMTLFHQRVLFPLPYRPFAADQVVEAFRTMQQSRHIGKVVVRLDGAQVRIEPERSRTVVARTHGGWIVTGGLTGFGLQSALWLAERGAEHLILVSRRGAATPGAAEAIAALEQRGARVELLAADIADRAALTALFDRLRHDGAPLVGVLHAAMVLDDAFIANLDAARFAAVLSPKLRGAWLLHELTRDFGLEHFILYSSVTTFIGNPGQANYVAANAGLERLAALRRHLGLPATCVAWGPIGDVGYLARNEAVREGLTARLGTAPLLAQAALAMLDPLLAGGGGTVAVSDLDWATLSRVLPSAGQPRFASLRQFAGPAGEAEEVRQLIAGKSPKETAAIIETLVRREVAQVLCIAVEAIDSATGLHQMGMDSLMAVELALGLEKSFGIQLPPMLLSEGPSVARVVPYLVERLSRDDRDDAEPAAGKALYSAAAALAARHGETLPPEFLAETVEEIQTMTGAN